MLIVFKNFESFPSFHKNATNRRKKRCHIDSAQHVKIPPLRSPHKSVFVFVENKKKPFTLLISFQRNVHTKYLYLTYSHQEWVSPLKQWTKFYDFCKIALGESKFDGKFSEYKILDNQIITRTFKLKWNQTKLLSLKKYQHKKLISLKCKLYNISKQWNIKWMEISKNET